MPTVRPVLYRSIGIRRPSGDVYQEARRELCHDQPSAAAAISAWWSAHADDETITWLPDGFVEAWLVDGGRTPLGDPDAKIARLLRTIIVDEDLDRQALPDGTSPSTRSIEPSIL